MIAGARPNFMKVAPIYAEMKRRESEFAPMIVHTGQHYDVAMSDAFFDDLGMPEPDIHLGVGSASHAVQTAKIMTEFEPVVLEQKPDWVLVVGDVNSTIACALVCAKLGVRVAHVEAGLRSRDRAMPEEINRILTDAISDLLFTTSQDADENLKGEGIAADKIRFVGNVMIDAYALMEAAIDRAAVPAALLLARLPVRGWQAALSPVPPPTSRTAPRARRVVRPWPLRWVRRASRAQPQSALAWLRLAMPP